LTKCIEKRIYGEKEAEIVTKNLFRIHSQQEVFFLCECWGVGGGFPIRAACIGMASPLW